MIEKHFYTIVLIWILIAVLLFPLLLRVKAPYGRHSSNNWGPLVNNKTAWILMELPSLVLFILLFLLGEWRNVTVVWIFFTFWILHYTNRIFIFPLRTHTRGKKMPLLIMLFATIFNLINGFINGYWLGFRTVSRELRAEVIYSVDWLTDPRFIIGVIFFIGGFILNQVTDNHLINLRKGNKSGYYLPTLGIFKYISCPNFLGEIIEWTGFALMTWSLPGLSFAIWTAANLIPRALHHHRWYNEEFPDYPKARKAIFPGIL